MNFIIHDSHRIARTIFEEDCKLFATIFRGTVEEKKVDQRLLIMITTGLLNRSFNLEDYLVAVLGQEWVFINPVSVGQTLSCEYSIKILKHEKNIYQIQIQLYADLEIVANGIWTVMLNQSIN